MKKTYLVFLGIFISGPASYAQNQVFHLNGNQVWGHVLTLATDNTAGADDARLLFSYRGKSKQWALGGINNTTRFSIWEDAGDSIYGTGGWGNERFTVVAGGNVGIGIATPNAKLDIQGTLLTGSGAGNIDPAGTAGKLSFLANSSQMLIGWNRTASSGEADFIANQGPGGTGGFAFYSHDNNNVETQLLRILGDGTVGIGTTAPNAAYKLSVNGSIRSKEVKVETGWADYVFNKGYNLKSLVEVKNFIEIYGHLPEVPTAAEVKKNGVNLGETESLLLKKIEELTLYLIEKDKEVNELKLQVNKNQELETRLKKVEKYLKGTLRK